MPQTETHKTHTPGSWESQPTAGHDNHGQSAVYAEADGKDIAVVYDGEPNARLISAAPELLEALEWAMKHVDRRGTETYNNNYTKAEAAIRKAKGTP